MPGGSIVRFLQYAVASTLAAVLLVGCTGKPSSSIGRRVVEHQIAQNSNGLLKLVSFKKINGTEAEPMGLKIYEMEYEAEIEFVDNCAWGDSFSASRVSDRPNAVFDWQAFGNAMMGRKNGRRGSRAKVTGTITFRMTDNGWFAQ